MSSIDYDELAGQYYLDVFRFDLASGRAESMLMNAKNKFKGLNLLATIAYQKAIHAKDEVEKQKLFAESESYFLELLKLNINSPESHFGLAMIYIQQSNGLAAMRELDESLALNDDYLSAHVAAAQINKQQYLASKTDTRKAEKMLYHLNRADRLNPGNPEIQFDEGLAHFYLHEYISAAEYFRKALKNPSLEENSRKMAEKCLYECGLK